MGGKAGRREAIDQQAALRAAFDALQASMGNVVSQVTEFMGRAAKDAARAQSERSNIERREKKKDGETSMTVDQYRAHILAGGQAIPEMEDMLRANAGIVQ